MHRNVLIGLAGLALAWMLGGTAIAQKMPRYGDGEVGRYRLEVGESPWIYLIDTTTGQCWSRGNGGVWRDLGRPPELAEDEPEPVEVKLDLPKDVELTVLQRESRAIPGSDGSVRLRLGDITDGQAFLSVETINDKVLVERTSVSPGDEVTFRVQEKPYTIRVKELRNLLIGDDFARLTISEAEPEAEEAARPVDKSDAERRP